MGNNKVPYTFAVGENLHISYTIVTNPMKTIKLKKEIY